MMDAIDAICWTANVLQSGFETEEKELCARFVHKGTQSAHISKLDIVGWIPFHYVSMRILSDEKDA